MRERTQHRTRGAEQQIGRRRGEELDFSSTSELVTKGMRFTEANCVELRQQILEVLNVHSPSSCRAAPIGQRSPTSLPPQQSNTMEGKAGSETYANAPVMSPNEDGTWHVLQTVARYCDKWEYRGGEWVIVERIVTNDFGWHLATSVHAQLVANLFLGLGNPKPILELLHLFHQFIQIDAPWC